MDMDTLQPVALPTLESLPPPSQLAYSIHSFSSYTSSYHPSLILVDSPSDQSSRWTGATSGSTSGGAPAAAGSTAGNGEDSGGTQVEATGGVGGKGREIPYLILELERPCVVQAIVFGKYHKLHPCNLSEFTIYGGMSPVVRNMEMLLHGGLRNDSVKERFDLSCTDSIYLRPIKYLRIEAHAAHSQGYNVSIWHIALHGQSTPELLKGVMINWDEYRYKRATYLVLAHLRRSFLLTPFFTLLKSLPPALSHGFEYPTIQRLWEVLVLRGRFVADAEGREGAEDVLEDCREAGLFNEWGRRSIAEGPRKGVSTGRWERVIPDQYGHIEEGDVPRPVGRGGHQMVRVGRKLLLFGGWDGTKDLGDLWEWDLARTREEEADGRSSGWRLLDDGSAEERRKPRARSCHQLAVDESTGWVYLLGGMEEGSESATTNGSAPVGRRTDAPDFWRYKAVGTGKGTWELLSENTEADGGPKLIYDHQMLVHSDSQTLYVFGGKLSAPVDGSGTYSGMFSYNIQDGCWTAHFDDGTTSRLPTSPVNSRLFSRVGHSMIHDPNPNSLFIFAGGRLESYLSDLWSIKLPPTPSTSTAFVPLLPVLISSDYSTSGPPAGFTQRATIDTRTGDWTILSGMVKDPKGNGGVVDTGVWTRSVEGEWEKVVEKGGEVPDARFGGQFVYDPLRGEYWLMGGNPQDHETSTRRMGDLWRLRVERSSPEEALRMAKFLIRKQRFTEMCQTSPTLTALTYLQSSLSSVVDHTSESEAAAFRSCMTSLLSAPASNNNYDERMDEDDAMGSSTTFERGGGDVPVEAGDDVELFKQRHRLFEQLLDFFPDALCQPKDDLRDLAVR